MFSKIVLTFAAVAVAVQANSRPSILTSQLQEQKCGSSTTVSCCNSAAGAGKDGLAVSKSQCVEVPIVNIPIGNQCGGNNFAACCDNGDHNIDLINLSCLPISLAL